MKFLVLKKVVMNSPLLFVKRDYLTGFTVNSLNHPYGTSSRLRFLNNLGIAGGRRKHIGKESILGQIAIAGKVMISGFNHDRNAASIHLVLFQVLVILHHGFMHQSRPAMPVVRWQRLGQHGDKSKIAVLLLPALRQIEQI